MALAHKKWVLQESRCKQNTRTTRPIRVHYPTNLLLEVFFFQEKQKKKTPTSSNAASSFEQLIKYKAVMGQEIIKASEKNNRPPRSKSEEHPSALRKIPCREWHSAGAGQRRDASAFPSGARVILSSLLLPLCDQFSSICSAHCQSASTSPRYKKDDSVGIVCKYACMCAAQE